MHDLSPESVVTAIEENRCERFRLLRHWPRAEVHDDPDLLWVLTDLPLALFNSVLRARLEHAQVDAAVEAAVARCASRNVPMFWWTGPLTQPPNLGAALVAHGFREVQASRGMAADLWGMEGSAPLPQGLSVECVQDRVTLEEWTRVLGQVYALPRLAEAAWEGSVASIGFGRQGPLRCYLGRLNGEAVAISFVVYGAGVAGLYGMGTLPEARRLGVGSALARIPLSEARQEGYRVAVLASSERAMGIYERLGFRTYCTVRLYWWGPGQDRSSGGR